MCCGNKALTVFAYHVLTDVSGARDVNNIRCSQMRLLPLLLMERIRNWLNLFLKHCRVEMIWEKLGRFLLHSHIFSYQYLSFLHLCVSLVSPPCCPLIFLTFFFTYTVIPACHQWPSSASPCLPHSVFHLRVIIFRSRIGRKWIGSEGRLKRKEI